MSIFIKIGTKWGHDGPVLKQIFLDHSKFIFSSEPSHRFYSSNENDKYSLVLNKDTIFALADGFDIFAIALAKNDYANSFENQVGLEKFSRALKDAGVDYAGVWWVDVTIYPLPNTIYYHEQKGVCQIKSTNITRQLKVFYGELNLKNNTNKIKIATYPLNQILYGPPGTGKTYFTKAYAVAIELNQNVEYWLRKENRAALIVEYNKLILEERVKFCTFHQSMSYEDFIEGIKPVIKGEISYEITSGILLEFIEKFRTTQTINQINNLGTGKNLTELELETIAKDVDHASFEKEIYNGKIQKEYFEVAIKIFFIEFYSTVIKWPPILGKRSSSPFSISKHESTAEIFSENSYPFDEEKDSKIAIDNTYGVERAVTYYKLKSGFDTVKVKGKPDPHENAAIYIGAFIWKWFNIVFKDVKFENILSKNKADKKIILIIDEINRGNIAAIFGELITLLEESKRLSKPDETKVTLTYSKVPFCLPSNLYIIGTMNTADRSVEALDTALRRRFSFIEMPPRPEIFEEEIDGIDLNKLLTALNQRISALKDADHTIGHAWFIGCENKRDILTVMVDKVIPLLREHFYNENEKLEAVIGEQFFDSPQTDVKFLGNRKGEKVNLIKHLISRDVMLTKAIDLKLLYEVNS